MLETSSPCYSSIADEIQSEVGIMQTEELDSEDIDEIDGINPASFLEMTVKEEVDDPAVNLCDSSPCELSFEDSIVNSPLLALVGTEHEHFLAECSSEPALTSSRPSNDDFVEQDSDKNKNTHDLPESRKSNHHSHRAERGRGRGRRRSKWKLKFHHQALPPEYLDHYEAAMAQQDAASKIASSKSESHSKPSATRAVPPLVPRLVDQQRRLETYINQNLPNISIEASEVSSNVNKLGIDHLQIPLQPFAMGSDIDIFNRLQNSMHHSKKRISEERRRNESRESAEKFLNKGLLSSLLSAHPLPPPKTAKPPADPERKRSSVIMSSGGRASYNSRVAPVAATNYGNTTSSRVMKYQDLPYMGEITLDNMKPRRGRKPKKADICHLIYKNYGTIFPGAPDQNALAETHDLPKRKQYQHNTLPNHASNLNYTSTKTKPEFPSGIKCKPIEELKESTPINHADVQNRIINSLLEKRLTAASLDAKKKLCNNIQLLAPKLLNRGSVDILSGESTSWNTKPKVPTANTEEDEPLNLCIKDLNQLKIRLLRKHGNFYEPRSNNAVTIKSEPNSPSDVEEIDASLSDSPKSMVPKLSDTESTENSSRNETPLSIQKGDLDNMPPFPPFPIEFPNKPAIPADMLDNVNTSLPNGYVYWPNAGIFVHPMTLQSQIMYYQKMGGIPLVPMSQVDPSATFPSPATLQKPSIIPSTQPFISPDNNDVKSMHHKEPKVSPSLHNTTKDIPPKRSSTSSKPPVPDLVSPKAKRLAPVANLLHNPNIMPTKRKRSAIFIPPVPSENNTNPTTEVSICKFKFTGGAKPSLQEKKMLSVDSGGNFRYYSGTGDKSMRGYEFFPRESLQQSSLLSSNSTPAENFLNAAIGNNSEKGTNSFYSSQSSSKDKEGTASDDSKSEFQNMFPTLYEKVSKEMPELAILSAESMPKIQDGERIMSTKNDSSFETAKDASVQENETQFEENYSSADVNLVGDMEEEMTSQFKARKKRRTRKSIAREKLEQTFKEKGFLIQTQQLESAEGATYCKFRQLRKFTRYLFRSWKDYLPGNVREMSVAAGVANTEQQQPQNQELDSERELSRSNASTPNTNNLKASEDTSPDTFSP